MGVFYLLVKLNKKLLKTLPKVGRFFNLKEGEYIFMMSNVVLIANNRLRPHEKINLNNLKKLQKQILADGFIDSPLIVDKNTMIILDGHHRFQVLQLLGFTTSPVCFCRL